MMCHFCSVLVVKCFARVNASVKLLKTKLSEANEKKWGERHRTNVYIVDSCLPLCMVIFVTTPLMHQRESFVASIDTHTYL